MGTIRTFVRCPFRELERITEVAILFAGTLKPLIDERLGVYYLLMGIGTGHHVWLADPGRHPEDFRLIVPV